MRHLLTILVLTLSMLAGNAPSSDTQPTLLAEEARLMLPSGWFVANGTGSYPFIILADSSAAELMVFKSVLSRSEVIATADELRMSVEKVVTEVIGPLPQTEVDVHTGYLEINRAGFALEFTSYDTSSGNLLSHRLVGWLYTLPDSRQLLFTLWGRWVQPLDARVSNEIRSMQEAFAYVGPSQENVFGANSYKVWPVAIAFPVLFAFLWYALRRQAKHKSSSSNVVDSFWHCSCGRLNPARSDGCRRCGRPR